jgi:hypothetical protein
MSETDTLWLFDNKIIQNVDGTVRRFSPQDVPDCCCEAIVPPSSSSTTSTSTSGLTGCGLCLNESQPRFMKAEVNITFNVFGCNTLCANAFNGTHILDNTRGVGGPCQWESPHNSLGGLPCVGNDNYITLHLSSVGAKTRITLTLLPDGNTSTIFYSEVDPPLDCFSLDKHPLTTKQEAIVVNCNFVSAFNILITSL